MTLRLFNWISVHWWRVVCILLGFVFCSGCKVVDTIPAVSNDGRGCQGALGSYFLPRSLITFSIAQQEGQAFQLTVSEPTPDADRSRIYCLDYLGSPLADDTISVIRNLNLGVLQKIESENEDRSKDVALTAVQIGLIAATGNPNVTRKVRFVVGNDSDKTIVADFQIDPFDRQKLAEVNAAMASVYGYCAIIDGYTVPSGDIQSYCGSPRSYAAYAKAPSDAALSALPEDASRGILYRPNQTHQLIIFRRRDPQSRNRWQIYQTKRIDMPNVSPVFSVGVDRSAFVKRKTTLVFDDGVLRDITIVKPSELLSFVEIPLRVVQAVAQIPAEIIKVRIAATNNEKEIIAAQAGLIQTQRATAEAAANLRSTGSITGTDGNRSFKKQNSQVSATGQGPADDPVADCKFQCDGGANAGACQC